MKEANGCSLLSNLIKSVKTNFDGDDLHKKNRIATVFA